MLLGSGHLLVRSPFIIARRQPTLVTFSSALFNASRPPGPRLFPRDFFMDDWLARFWSRCSVAISAVALSFSVPEAVKDGKCASDCRDFGLVDLWSPEASTILSTHQQERPRQHELNRVVDGQCPPADGHPPASGLAMCKHAAACAIM